MKIHIFWIVLDFIQLSVSIQSNITIDKEPTDPITLLRDKRQLAEYTRWRSNLVTTQEFLVKVDDDAFNPTTVASSRVVAINIQPITKAREKIIIGGSVVPPVDIREVEETPTDYTRFVVPAITKATTVIDDVIYPPIKAIQSAQVPYVTTEHLDMARLPVTPKYITRTPVPVKQYAPITPVAFHPRPTESPLTPSVSPISNLYSPSRMPSRVPPTRINMEPKAFGSLTADEQDALENFFVTLETNEKQSYVTRTSSPIFMTSVRAWNQETEAIPTKQTTEDAFHMMFYSDEDREFGDSRRKTHESSDDDEKSNKQINDTNETEEETDSVANNSKGNNLQNKDLKSTASSVENCSLNATVQPSLGPEDSKTQIPKNQQMCSLVQFRPLGFGSPRTLPEIVSQIRKWSERSPIVKAIDITANNLTTMDNPIYMVIVDDPSSGQVISAKEIVMIVAGIQGRDHHAVTAAMYVLYQLIERTDSHADLLSKYRFWIIPVFNPDGYDYSMTFAQRREWRKNLHQSWEECIGRKSCKDCDSYGLRCTPQPCYGVHLDRNFEYQWIPAEELKAEHPCGELYAGSRQLSEPETRALTTFLHEQRTPISMFVAFKEGDVLGVMYPYSHTRKKRAYDQDYRRRASRAASAAFTISGRPYVAGQTSEFLPLYAGGMEDWVDGHLGIDNTYTIMMHRPTDAYNMKQMTELVVHEAYAALDTLLLETGHNMPAEAAIQRLKRPITRHAGRIIPVSTSTLLLVAAIPIFNS